MKMSFIFNYSARNEEGKKVEGVIKASTRHEVVVKLKNNDLKPIEVEKQKKKFSLRYIIDKLDSVEITSEKVSSKEKYVFCRQFSSMIKSGIPIINSLKLLASQMENESLQAAVQESILDLEKGHNLSSAFKKHPEIFSNYFISLIENGEAGGFLGKTLSNLAGYYKNKTEKRKQIMSEIRYPIIIMVASVVVVLLLMVGVLPNFIETFERMGVELPLPTRVLMFASNFLSAYWVWLLVIVFVLTGGLYRFYKTEKGKYYFDTLLLKLPVVRSFIVESSLITFAQNLSLLEQSGVDFLKGMKIVNNNILNSIIKGKLEEARNLIKDGISISSAIGRQKLFPPVALQMIEVGEETGELTSKLDYIVDFYQEEVEEKFQKLVSFIGPTMLVFLTLLIGGIVASVILPIFQMSQTMR